MSNYTPNSFMTQPIYDQTRPFATPTHNRSCWFLLCLKPLITMVAPFLSSPFHFKFFSLIFLPLLGYINGVYGGNRWVGVGF